MKQASQHVFLLLWGHALAALLLGCASEADPGPVVPQAVQPCTETISYLGAVQLDYTFVLDADGRPTQRETRDGAGTLVAAQTYDYDSEGNVLETTETALATGLQTRVSYDYNDDQSAYVATTTQDGAVTGRVEVTLNTTGLPTIERYETQGLVFTHAYDTAGHLVETRTMSISDGEVLSVTTLFYDDNGRRIREEQREGPIHQIDLQYVYEGDLLVAKERTNAVSGEDAGWDEYIYDAFDRLISETLWDSRDANDYYYRTEYGYACWDL